ncbi:protein unc-13 homolog D-like isoform X2 [Eriocheir sinensis]|uniref:protein unc-13 homolog D-like isoform X2 n=1 Tax=Eriocheir sinensis TaxID=95602 RepID=UPI0021C9B1D5|nr:protein unc-13 homolog D-like isoform X2 [Eriocheir sinensis]
MFKAYTLALRKTLEASLPGTRGAQHTKVSRAASGHPAAAEVTEQLEDEIKGEKYGGSKSRLERTSEEHWTLVAGHVFQAWTGNCPRRSYQSSLARALTPGSTEVPEGEARTRPWDGHLSPAALQQLARLADELDLAKESQQLAWWLVGSRLASVDAEWIFSQLKNIQAALVDNTYTEEEKADLLHSLTLYIYSQIKRLKSLHTAFPGGCCKQLTFTLRTLQHLEQHPATRRLLDTAGQPPIPEDAAAALQRHARERWCEVVQVEASKEEPPEQQLRRSVHVASRVPPTLKHEAEMYRQIFEQELSVPYGDICRREAINSLDNLAKTILAPGDSTPQTLSADRQRNGATPTHLQNFAVGSPLWSLYKALGRAYSACGKPEGDVKAATHYYPGCFLRSVAAWLEPTNSDTEMNYAHSGSSSASSLLDVLTAFTEAREWWRELAWPDPETRGVVAVGLLENLCSLATRRCQGVTARRQSVSFDAKFCSCLKSVSRVAEEVRQLSDDLGLEEVVEGMRKCGNEGAADQAKDTVSTLLSSVGQNLENLLDQFIDAAIDQMMPKLRDEVVEVCERGGSSTPPSLSYTLSLLQEHLPHSSSRSHYVPPGGSDASSASYSPCLTVCSSPSLLQRLLARLWDAVVLQFMITVAEKTGRQTSEYFCRVHSILEATLALFTSPGRLHPRAAATPGYRSVAEQVEGQRKSSSALILQYYYARLAQQTRPDLPTLAHVLVRAFLSQPGRLTVRVLEARDVTAAAGRSPLRYHVTVQVVPREACPGAALHRTTAVTHCPASFYETFEFPTCECRGEGSIGLLLFTLEAARGSSGNWSFLGEAFLPLAAIPYVDSPELQNTTLRMTAPAFPPGYESVTALRARAGTEERAAAFIRSLERRHPEARSTGHPKTSKAGL